jgi:hypothetical protein
MLKIATPAIKAMFAGGEPQREPVNFSWRLLTRKKVPFLLMPENSGDPSFGMELYSAQRPLAKLWRLLIPFMLQTPAAKVFHRIAIQVDAASELMQFLARQSGVPAREMQTPAIKFGYIAGKISRLVVLLCDVSGRPIRIVKVGLDPEGRAVTEREADLLSQLPTNITGCTGITGRFSSATLSAFATSFFPGASLDKDWGIEKLFHDWLNDTPPEPIENLALWHELESAANRAHLPEWPALRDALTGQRVRTTIFQGDFAPWNVHLTNLENIQAFDWESGHLRGIPAWDWFHFIVQTSILARRHSLERTAAEVEQLVCTPRFQKYANETGISRIIEPLLLAYLLHRKIVAKPREGGELTDRLFRLFWARWQMKVAVRKPTSPPIADLRRPAVQQIKSAFVMLANLFWEPSLSPDTEPPLSAQLTRYWLALLAALLWIGGVATLQFLTVPFLTFAPFYLAPCVVLVLKADRWLGFIAACVAGVTGPLVQHCKHPGLIPLGVTCWNMVMRALVFQVTVILLDHVHRRSLYHSHDKRPEQNPIQGIANNWAVILITSIYFALVVLLDVLTNPHLTFLPLYLLPCVIFTLALNWRWGTIAAVAASIAGPLSQSFQDPNYQSWGVEFWNTCMRLVIFQTIVLLVDRYRRENILFVRH